MTGQERDLDGVPRARRGARAHGFIEYGDPVKPWLTSTPIRRPPVSSGRAGSESGAAGASFVMAA